MGQLQQDHDVCNVIDYRRISLGFNMIGPLDESMRPIAGLIDERDAATGQREQG